MNSEKRLYRSRDALLGGVCAGIAEYFSVDPIVARILAIVLTLSTAGIGAVAYAALWVILPKAADTSDLFDVEPQSIRSETYGHVDYRTARVKADDAARAVAEAATATWRRDPDDVFFGVGHVPPEPPSSVEWVPVRPPQTPPGWQGPFTSQPCPPQKTQTGDTPHVSQSPFASGVSGQSQVSVSPPPGRSGGVKAALWIGLFFLFFGVIALIARFVEGVSWWQFWPLFFIIAGIGYMVVPGELGHRMMQFVNGLILFCVGGVMLPMSLGLLDWMTIEAMLEHLWPLLLIMVGLFIVATALQSSLWSLAAGLCFVAFCVIGLWGFAVPGTTDVIILTIPFGREYLVPVDLGPL